MNAPTRIETGTMTSKGQILIPKAIRDAVGLVPGEPYQVILDDEGRVIVSPLCGGRGDVERRRQMQADVIEAMAGRFDFGGSTDAFMREMRGDYRP